jgi:hypothetical protein
MFATKRKSYGDVAKSKIYQSIGMILIQILGYKFGTSALLMGHAVGQSLGVIRLYLKNEFTDNLKQYSSKKNIIETEKYLNDIFHLYNGKKLNS